MAKHASNGASLGAKSRRTGGCGMGRLTRVAGRQADLDCLEGSKLRRHRPPASDDSWVIGLTGSAAAAGIRGGCAPCTEVRRGDHGSGRGDGVGLASTAQCSASISWQ
jgi:hypothetical protein